MSQTSTALGVGAHVTVVGAVDRDIHDQIRFLGRIGTVVATSPWCGESMFTVKFAPGLQDIFHPEELADRDYWKRVPHRRLVLARMRKSARVRSLDIDCVERFTFNNMVHGESWNGE